MTAGQAKDAFKNALKWIGERFTVKWVSKDFAGTQ